MSPRLYRSKRETGSRRREKRPLLISRSSHPVRLSSTPVLPLPHYVYLTDAGDGSVNEAHNAVYEISGRWKRRSNVRDVGMDATSPITTSSKLTWKRRDWIASTYWVGCHGRVDPRLPPLDGRGWQLLAFGVGKVADRCPDDCQGRSSGENPRHEDYRMSGKFRGSGDEVALPWINLPACRNLAAKNTAHHLRRVPTVQVPDRGYSPKVSKTALFYTLEGTLHGAH